MLTLARGVLSVPLLMSMLDAFSVPILTWIKLCYTKALEWSSLVPGPEAQSPSEIKNPTLFTVHYHADQLISSLWSPKSRCSGFQSLRITWSPQQYIGASASSSVILAVGCSSEVPPFRPSLSSFSLPPRPGERQTQSQADPSLVRETVEKQDVGRLRTSLRSWRSSPSLSTWDLKRALGVTVKWFFFFRARYTFSDLLLPRGRPVSKSWIAKKRLEKLGVPLLFSTTFWPGSSCGLDVGAA